MCMCMRTRCSGCLCTAVQRAGLLAEIRSASHPACRALSVRVAQGRIAKQEAKPAVWNTARYKELWSLALKAGDEQEQCHGARSAVQGAMDASCAAAGSDVDRDASNATGEDMDAVDADEVVPLGDGLHLMQSFPGGDSSDGSESKIAAHYPSSGGGAGTQDLGSS